MWFWEEYGEFLFLETLHLIEMRDKENYSLMKDEQGLALGIFLSRWPCSEPTHQHTRNHYWQMLHAKAFPAFWLSSWEPDASQSFLKSTVKRVGVQSLAQSCMAYVKTRQHPNRVLSIKQTVVSSLFSGLPWPSKQRAKGLLFLHL